MLTTGWSDLSDGGLVDEADPGDALLPGSANDVQHQPPLIVPGDQDYVPPAEGVDSDDDFVQGPETEPVEVPS